MIDGRDMSTALRDGTFIEVEIEAPSWFRSEYGRDTVPMIVTWDKNRGHWADSNLFEYAGEPLRWRPIRP